MSVKVGPTPATDGIQAFVTLIIIQPGSFPCVRIPVLKPVLLSEGYQMCRSFLMQGIPPAPGFGKVCHGFYPIGPLCGIRASIRSPCILQYAISVV